MNVQRQWSDIFKKLKEKQNKTNYQPKILYLTQSSSKNEQKFKTFPDKQNREHLLLVDLVYKKVFLDKFL